MLHTNANYFEILFTAHINYYIASCLHGDAQSAVYMVARRQQFTGCMARRQKFTRWRAVSSLHSVAPSAVYTVQRFCQMLLHITCVERESQVCEAREPS